MLLLLVANPLVVADYVYRIARCCLFPLVLEVV
jgi:hypothetical protein